MAKGKKTTVVDITPHVEDENSQALVSYVKGKTLPEALTTDIISTIGPIFKNIETWREKVESIVITSSEDTTAMKLAREARLDISKIRTGLKKQVDEKKLIIKTEKIDPVKREYDGWSEMFEFVEGMLKGLEKSLKEKEEYALILKKKEQDAIREERKVLAEPFRAYMPPMVDIALLSQEDFEKALETAKLAQEGDRIRKEKEQKEAEEREAENKKLKIINSRINLLSSMNFKFEDDNYIYGGDVIKVSSSMIKDMSVEDFNTYVDSVESQIREIEREAKEKEEKERLERMEAAEKKRKIIMDRISKIQSAKIEKDGLYLEIHGTEKEFLITYDEIFAFSDDAADEYIHQTNLNTSKKIDAIKERQMLADFERMERLKLAEEAKKEAEEKIRIEREKAEKAAMNDKNKLKAVADQVHDFKKELVNDFVLTSDQGRSIFNHIINNLADLVKYIDDKTK